MAIEEVNGQFVDTGPRTPERGQAIEWGWIQVGRDRSIGYTSSVDIEDVKRCLQDDAARELPPNTRYELRQRYPNNYGRTHGMAWYWTSTFADAPTWEPCDSMVSQEDGYLLLGRFITPAPLNVAETASKIGGE